MCCMLCLGNEIITDRPVVCRTVEISVWQLLSQHADTPFRDGACESDRLKCCLLSPENSDVVARFLNTTENFQDPFSYLKQSQ